MPEDASASGLGLAIRESDDGQTVVYALPSRRLGWLWLFAPILLIPLGMVLFLPAALLLAAWTFFTQSAAAAATHLGMLVCHAFTSLAAFLFVRWGLLSFFGRTRIQLTPTELVTTEVAWPFRSARSAARQQLRALTVTTAPNGKPYYADGEEPTAPADAGQVLPAFLVFGNARHGRELVATTEDGTNVSLAARYPADLLSALGTDISRRCGLPGPRLVSDGRRDAGPAIPPHAARPAAPLALPPGSDLNFVQFGHRLEITIPPRPIRRQPVWWGPFVIGGFLIPFTVGVGGFLWPAARQTGGGAFWLLCGMGLLVVLFWCLVVSHVAFVIHAARRHAVITADHREVTIQESGLFPTRRRSWARAAISDVRTAITQGTGGPSGHLVIEHRKPNGRTAVAYLFFGLQPEELEWLAASLR